MNNKRGNMKNLKAGSVGQCVICFRTVTRRSKREVIGAVGEREREQVEDYMEMVPKSVVSTSQFLHTFNEVWEVFQNKNDNSDEVSGVGGEGISLERVMMMGRLKFPTTVKFTKEAPPTMCQRCCDKIITVDSLMKVVRQQVGEIKMLIMESSIGGSFQGSATDIQVKNEHGDGILSQEDVQIPSSAGDPLNISASVSALASMTQVMPTEDDEGQLTSQIEIHEEKLSILHPLAADPNPDPIAPPPYSIVQFGCSNSSCNVTFDNYYNYMEHRNSCHSLAERKAVVPEEQLTATLSVNNDESVCPIIASTSISTLDYGQPICQDGKKICPKCHKDLTMTAVRKHSDARRHVINCGKPPQFQCPFCSVKIRRKSYFKKHLKKCSGKYLTKVVN